MPSNSLRTWSASRKQCLDAIDIQCAASIATLPANPLLAEENVRGYGLLLSAHFQGFCRDLYTEAAQVISSKVRLSLRSLVQRQFGYQCMIDHGNPTNHNIKKDFSRLGGKFNFSDSDPANAVRLGYLNSLNVWRNIAAHHGYVPAGGVPDLADLRGWWKSCDGLATSLDEIVYNRLRVLLRREPWTP